MAIPELPSYRGDIINGGFRLSRRRRAFPIRSGCWRLIRRFGPLASPRRAACAVTRKKLDQRLHWRREAARDIADRISDAMAFMAVAGVTAETAYDLGRWTSAPATRRRLQCHEALARDRFPPPACRSQGQGHHDLDWRPRAVRSMARTSRFARGVPGPDRPEMRPLDPRCSDLKALIAKLNLETRAGRLTLIARFGCRARGRPTPPRTGQGPLPARRCERPATRGRCDGSTIKSASATRPARRTPVPVRRSAGASPSTVRRHSSRRKKKRAHFGR